MKNNPNKLKRDIEEFYSYLYYTHENAIINGTRKEIMMSLDLLNKYKELFCIHQDDSTDSWSKASK